MAAGATGATAGKGNVAGTPRAASGAMALLAGQGHEHGTATGEAAQGVKPAQQARQPQDAAPRRDSTSDAAGEAGGGAAGVRAQARVQGTRARGGADRNSAHPAGFAQALDRLRTTPVPPAATAAAGQAAQAADGAQLDVPADLAGTTNEPAATKEDPADASLAGDAASASLAAVLQWLRPVVPVTAGDAHGESPQGQEQGGESAIAAATAVGAATAVDSPAAAGAPAIAVAVDSSGKRMAAGLSPDIVAGPRTMTPAVALAMPSGPTVAAATEDATDAMQPAASAAGSAGPVAPSNGSSTRAPGAANPPAGDASTSTIDQGLEALASAIRKVVALDDAGSGRDAAGRDSSPPSGEGATPAAAAAGKAGGAGDATASGAAAVAAAQRAATTAATERTVPVPVHDRHWPQAMAGQVLVLADQRIDSATLRLSPGHLGPVEVHIDLQSAGINVSFGAEHADTRAALEQALPQLRAAFAGAGLTLGQATVQQQLRQGSQNAPATAQDRGPAADHSEVTPAVIRAIGLVDEYA